MTPSDLGHLFTSAALTYVAIAGCVSIGLVALNALLQGKP